jgi:hypothetical protein
MRLIMSDIDPNDVAATIQGAEDLLKDHGEMFAIELSYGSLKVLTVLANLGLVDAGVKAVVEDESITPENKARYLIEAATLSAELVQLLPTAELVVNGKNIVSQFMSMIREVEGHDSV